MTEYPSINIVYFAVAESFQNKGFGKELMLSLLGNIYDHRLEFGGLSFVTVENLPESQSFYRKNFAFD
ncbi:GNAT family N-acetyltransferase [Oenococcus sp.]|uniref:GNAT family N-acetyltransferase n=1 Tax=Oenococcus sp. TaxID=1979414 RepID=UPI0039EAEBB5